MNTKKTTATRAAILLAANRLLLQVGANQLTLEAVAQEAGVSKGGLLYHFPSKEALIADMVEFYLAQFEQRLEQQLPNNASPDADTAWFQAYIQATFAADTDETQAASALLAAIAINPELLAPMRERYAVWQAHFSQQMTDSVLGTIIRLALDGLWVTELLSLAPPAPELRDQILARLLAWVRSSGSASTDSSTDLS